MKVMPAVFEWLVREAQELSLGIKYFNQHPPNRND